MARHIDCPEIPLFEIFIKQCIQLNFCLKCYLIAQPDVLSTEGIAPFS